MSENFVVLIVVFSFLLAPTFMEWLKLVGFRAKKRKGGEP